MLTPTAPNSQASALNEVRVEEALRVVAPKWTTWVVQTLAHHGPMRVSEINAGLPFVHNTLLSKRLAEMESRGLLTRANATRAPYQLSEAGRALAPIHRSLADWSQTHLPRLGQLAGAERVEDALRRLAPRNTTAVIQTLEAHGPLRLTHAAEASGLDLPSLQYRLNRLQRDELVTRNGPRHGDPYTLTEAGLAALPILESVERWGQSLNAPPPAAAPGASRVRTSPEIITVGTARTAAALRRTAAPPSGLFSHSPAPQPRVPAAITARSTPGRTR
ncbi:winged helix-turn-helix transcriptional regulator [Kitasatospora sp. NPDC052896]|uniref:winged helix-turn-helix transcriptional regulator n=1 Tax=Kitasatospora sp. NPDC052896 TaxID=3364061 RepID=UPI0037CC954F